MTNMHFVINTMFCLKHQINDMKNFKRSCVFPCFEIESFIKFYNQTWTKWNLGIVTDICLLTFSRQVTQECDYDINVLKSSLECQNLIGYNEKLYWHT